MSIPMLVVVVSVVAFALAAGWYGRGIYENLTGYNKLREADRRRGR